MTVIRNLYPRPIVGPEPGVVAAYDFDPADLALGRYTDKSGNGVDLTTRVGVPIVGQGGGLLINEDTNSLWRAAGVLAVGNTTPSYAVVLEHAALDANTRWMVLNGAGGGHGLIKAGGNIYSTFNTGVGTHLVGNWSNRGPYRVGYGYAGGFFTTLVNGRVVGGPTAVVPTAPAGVFEIGRHGTYRAVKASNSPTWTAVTERASYVRDFAKQVLFHWKPDDDGEGGIATGQTGHGWYAPVGGAGLSHVWRTDLSEPNGGHLALTGDTGSMARVCFDFGRPFFGSWLITYEARNPVFGGDNPRIGFHATRGGDFTLAGSGSYWLDMGDTGGGWWRTRAYRDNSLAIGGGVDVDTPSIAANYHCAALLTRTVTGDFRVYTFVREFNQWYWRLAAVGNDVTYLSTNFISIAPRGSYITSLTYTQGEITPHELDMRL